MPAGQLIALKADVSSGPTVTLGDLFDGSGADRDASIVVGNGAPPAESAVLDAGAVQQIARRARSGLGQSRSKQHRGADRPRTVPGPGQWSRP